MTGGMQKPHFKPKADDVKAVMLDLAANGKFDVIEMLFRGGTTTIPQGGGGVATELQCKLNGFPLEDFIKSASQYCTPNLVEQLLHRDVAPDGPPGNPPEAAWTVGRDDILAVLIRNGANLSGLMRKLFGQTTSPDNMLHGAVKIAVHTGEITW